MAPSHHKKSHHAHETTDAFAEGWDAHESAFLRFGPSASPPVNPYRSELAAIEELHAKRSPRQVDGMKTDAELWDQGWADWEELRDKS